MSSSNALVPADQTNKALLKSPRTMEACSRLGYELDELVYKTELELKLEMGKSNKQLNTTIIFTNFIKFFSLKNQLIGFAFR